jgi:SAM-dependent methyltransferase
MTDLHQSYRTFWTPDRWRTWREGESAYRRYKSTRDRELAVGLLALRDGERVLEVGCGYGWISTALVRAAKIRWTGVDLSGSMLEYCLSANGSGVTGSGLVSDGQHLPFRPGVFDAVLCSGVLMHVRDEVAVLRELVRVLRPGGRLVVSGNNLLTPLGLAVWLFASHRKGVKQSFRLPWTYRRWLCQLGLCIERVSGDTLLAIGITLPFMAGSFPPNSWFRLMSSADRWLSIALPYFAYEIWVSAVKES